MSEPNEMTRLQSHRLGDYHSHCDYSLDAGGSIEEYRPAAVKRGLSEICFGSRRSYKDIFSLYSAGELSRNAMKK